jgi:tetratricopeptide (TPR) repeat protein
VNLAAGNPALVGQIVRLYHETGVLVATDDFDDERWAIHADKLAAVKLPLTVQDAVQARIAALVPEDRELLERAAAMGGVFWLGGLVAVGRQLESPPEIWEGGEADDLIRIRSRLTELVDRDYVLRLPDSTFAGDEEYVFKHNLEREAIEALTPPASARRYNRSISEWLSFRPGVETSEEYLEMLARHRERAGALALAASSYVRAGEVSRSRGAHAKAAELLSKGLELLERGGHPDEDLRLRSLSRYGDVLQALGRNDAALGAFAEMRARAWRLDLRSQGGTAHARIGRLYRDRGKLEEASRQLTAALALFGQVHDDRGIANTLDDIGKVQWHKGDYALALEYTLRALALRRKGGDRANTAQSLYNLGLIQQHAGTPSAAMGSLQLALQTRRELGDLVGVSIALTALGLLARELKDEGRALGFLREAYEIGKETGDRNRIALIVANLGIAQTRLGDDAGGAGMLSQAEALIDELGDRVALAKALCAIGGAYAERRLNERARYFVERAVRLLSEAESQVELGSALRLLGEVTAAGGNLAAAGAHFDHAIRVFEQVGNEMEAALTCRAFADALQRSPERDDPATVAHVAALAKRSERVLSRHRSMPDDEVTDVTDPPFPP